MNLLRPDHKEPTGEILPDERKTDGKILARVAVERKDRQINKVKAFAVDRAKQDTVFKVRFETESNGLSAYYSAAEMLKSYAKDNDYVIDGGIQTNVDLPFIRTVKNKSMR